MPVGYPKTKYHPVLAPRVVADAAAEAALGDEWEDSPAAFTDKKYGFDLKDVGDKSIPLDDTDTGNAEHVTYYVEWEPGTTGGLIWVTSAAYKTYEGEWAKIGEIPWEKGNKQDRFAVPGLHGAHRLEVINAVQGGPKAQGFALWK